ncbi:MAG: hypothetical protein AB1779_09445, partial [Candidatus Thermoplasmatota archaeon]
MTQQIPYPLIDIADNESHRMGNSLDSEYSMYWNSYYDGLNDGMEARGWTVGIHWERTMENKETRDVYSNPTIWDTEGDGVKDYFEFINGADPTRADTDDDLLLDNVEINPDDGTQISNPIGIEGEPPVIGTFEVKVKAKPGILAGWEMTISFDITDNAGLDYVIIDVI